MVQFGQLGVGSIVDVCAPTKVTNLEPTDFKGLACGWRHTMAVTVNGEIFSWGRGVNGQLGHGDGQDSCVPCSLAMSFLRCLCAAQGPGHGWGQCYCNVPDCGCEWGQWAGPLRSLIPGLALLCCLFAVKGAAHSWG